MKSPSIVLADEPTGALDAANAETVFDVLTEIADRGASIVIATHDDRIASRCHQQLHLAHLQRTS